MKWVTTEHVHLDRVACPWLIVRFIDPEAEFLFVARDKQDQLPDGAIPVAISGTELGPHDADGTTFDKILKKYNLNDPALVSTAAGICTGAAAQECTTGSVVACPRSPWEGPARGATRPVRVWRRPARGRGLWAHAGKRGLF